MTIDYRSDMCSCVVVLLFTDGLMMNSSIVTPHMTMNIIASPHNNTKNNTVHCTEMNVMTTPFTASCGQCRYVVDVLLSTLMLVSGPRLVASAGPSRHQGAGTVAWQLVDVSWSCFISRDRAVMHHLVDTHDEHQCAQHAINMFIEP